MAEQHYLEFRRQDQMFESVASFAFHPVTLTGAGDPVRLRGAAVTLDFFRVLRVNPAAGRVFLENEEQIALLSDTLWRSRFGGDPNVIGKTIRLDGADEEPYSGGARCGACAHHSGMPGGQGDSAGGAGTEGLGPVRFQMAPALLVMGVEGTI